MSGREAKAVERHDGTRRALGVALLALLSTLSACQPDQRPSAAAAPVIASFDASPNRLDPGESAWLSWSVVRAERLILLREGVHLAETSGSEQYLVSPASTTSYTLRATNASGTTTRSLTVIVDVEPVMVELIPEEIRLGLAEEHTFQAVVTGSEDEGVQWSATCGEVDGVGTTATYTAPDEAGTCLVQARSTADPLVSASATVHVEGR